jgi:diguanylate cyclase (GGDEF)-like protein
MIELAGYRIDESVAHSPPISIYRGIRLADGAAIIAKVLEAEFPTPVQLARIRHEYELLKGLDHPGVVKVHALERIGNSLAIVMEDVSGVPLRSLIAEDRLTLSAKLAVAWQIADILGYVHGCGIVHKDINPNNILVDPAGEIVKVIDFGSASLLPQEDAPLDAADHLVGTLAYIAPEQTGRMNRPVDYRSDFYSLGITLYELLLGERPFTGSGTLELVHRHLAAVPPSLHRRDPLIPPALSRVVDKLIAKNAEDRYQSAVGLCRDLKACEALVAAGAPGDDFVPGRLDVSDRFTVPSRLYGRDEQVALLAEAYAGASAGRSGVVLVAGPSGIGKSALIHEIHKPIAERNGLFIAGKYDQCRRNLPYSAIIQAFQALLHQILAGSEEAIANWRERILAAVGGNAQIIIDVLPDLRHITGPQPEAIGLPPQEAQNRFILCFVNFIRVFADPQHPLVLFLDDLQWADHASLNLLGRLGASPHCRHLLVLGAYRDNEVDATHPLRRTLAEMTQAGVAVKEISLGKLTPETVCEIVADTVSHPAEMVRPLAALIARKTDGNPFFIGQLLKSLHRSGLIAFDLAAGSWRWDLERIGEMAISDDVAELMSAYIRTLPAATRALLELAACIGSKFTLHEVSVISERSWDDIAARLREALAAGLITPVGDEYRFFGGDAQVRAGDFTVCYRFVHDRIMQAAHDLLGPEERRRTHFKAGELLLRSTPDEALDDRLFDIADHFNQAADLARDPALRRRLATLNLRAAVKAKTAIAYEPALRHIEHARAFLEGALPGGADDTLAFRIRLEHAECQALAGNPAAAEALYREALAAAGDDIGRTTVLEAMVHFFTNTGRFRDAYDTGRQALRLVGVSLPATFVAPLFALDLLAVKWRMRGRSVADLIDLPLCRDERLVTAMRLVAALLKAAYQIRPELCIACAVKAVKLSLTHGTTEDNAVAYVVFGGIFIGGVLGKHAAGHAFGKLALAMNERFDNHKQRSEINFVSAYFTNIWLEPAANAEAYYRAAYDSGLQTGDFFHLSCAACTMVESQFIRGVPLDELRRLGEEHLTFMRRIGSDEAAGAIQAVLRAAANLQGVTSSPSSFSDRAFDEAAFVERLAGFTSQHFAHFYFVNKMQTLYLWGLYDEALRMAQRSEGFLKVSIAMLHTVEHHFYHGLILCALGGKANLRKAAAILRRFEAWARLNPASFSHKALLLRAELARFGGNDWSVAELYSRAIRAAEDSGYGQNKALANELAGRFFASRNVDTAARAHLRAAYYGYQMWGAEGIAGRLAHDFPFVRGDSVPLSAPGEAPHGSRSSHRTSRTPSIESAASLDIETVIKATHAISSEIKLDTLLQTLVTIMMENAGAERGCFIRLDQGRLLVEAERFIDRDEAEVLGGLPPDPATLPLSVVQYVARLGESVVLEAGHSDERFRNDPYLLDAAPKSMLCTPVIRHGQVAAVVYLENGRTRGALTAKRLEMIRILASQAAISLENALLYESLDRRVRERTAELLHATEQLRSANEALEKLTFTDSLTQVSNKRHFQQVFDAEWRRAIRAGLPVTVMLVDIDHFKLFNDTYGHVLGDDCLSKVAAALRNAVTRTGDLLARFGGEEFAIVLPNTRVDAAAVIASRLIEAVRALGIPHGASPTAETVTISLGLAEMVPTSDRDPNDLIGAADGALYDAKRGGRNRFCVAQS